MADHTEPNIPARGESDADKLTKAEDAVLRLAMYAATLEAAVAQQALMLTAVYDELTFISMLDTKAHRHGIQVILVAIDEHFNRMKQTTPREANG